MIDSATIQTARSLVEVGRAYLRNDRSSTSREKEIMQTTFETITVLMDEIDRLTNENTYHSTQLDRAREEIQRLQKALAYLGKPYHDEELEDVRDIRKIARQALEGATT